MFVEIDEKNLYLANNLIEKIKSSRPGYPMSSAAKVGLYILSYIEFKPYCREKEEFTNF
jgi:hypothetical protein